MAIPFFAQPYDVHEGDALMNVGEDSFRLGPCYHLGKNEAASARLPIACGDGLTVCIMVFDAFCMF